MDTFAIFIGWLTFGYIMGALISSRTGIVTLIAFAVAFICTVLLTVWPKISPFWWILVVLGIFVMLTIPSWRVRFVETASVLYRLLFGVETFYERRLEQFIRTLAIMHKQTYRIVNDVITINVESNGTSDSKREMEIAAKTEPVRLIDLAYYVVNVRKNYPLRFTEPEITDKNGNKLDYVFYEDMPHIKRLLIALREPIQLEGSSERVTVNRRVEGSWIKLLEELRDEGTYTARNEVNQVKYLITVPPTYRINAFRVSPTLGKTSISPDGQTATWVAESPENNKTYTHIVECVKTS